MSKNRIFSILIVFFLIGVFIAPYFPFDDLILFITFLLLFILLFIFWKNPIVRIAILSSVFLIFGFWRFYYSVPPVDSSYISFFNGKDVEIEGFISNYPQEKDKSETFQLDVVKIKEKDSLKDIRGKVYVLRSKLGEFEYGEKLKLKGVLEKVEDSEDSNLKSFFIARGIYSKMIVPEIKKEEGFGGNFVFKILFALRKSFEERVSQVFTEPFSSLILGINIGAKKVSKDLLDIFNFVSISHIIVISGYNLSVVSDFFKKIFQNFSRKLSFWLPFGALILFTIFVGAEPPVVRAAIMASILLLAKKKGRKANGVFVLLFAAFIMTALNPFLLRFDVGFQLSFLATLGLVLISDKILAILKKIKIPPVLSEALSATLAAQIFILPLLIFYFGRLSLIAPVSNLLILPVVPFIMFSSFLVTLIGFISIEIARFLSLVPFLLLSYLINISGFLSRIPYASLSLEKSGFFVGFYYLVLCVPWIFKKWKRTNLN